MPNNYGRMTEDEASPALKKFLFGSKTTCDDCTERRHCPYVGQVCAMFKLEQSVEKRV